ncbi:MAG: hypothetical protein J6I64_00010 [Lachnospiraceae bacterium]|nr:hypothetical protein [Lachnospiraceae bacterium]
MNINASELGIAFVKECFALFQGSGYFLYLTAICLLYLLVRKKEPWKSFWGSYGAFLLLVVFNPLIWRVVDLLALDDEYYRFLWMIPVTPLIAYTATLLIMKAKKNVLRVLALGGAVAVIVLSGQSIFSRSWDTIENIYKIPDEVIEICEIIRADCEKEEPVVASDFDLSVLLNQYAPEMNLILSYRQIAILKEVYSYGEFADIPEDRLFHVLIEELPHDEGYLVYALQEGNVDYIVAHRGLKTRDYILESQCSLIAELEQYCIFRVELE